MLEMVSMILFMFVMIANLSSVMLIGAVHVQFFQKAELPSWVTYVLSGVLAIIGFVGGLFLITKLQHPVNDLQVGEYTKLLILMTTLLFVTILPAGISFGTYKIKNRM